MKNSQLLQQLAEALATIDSLRAQVKDQELRINSLRTQNEVQMRNLEQLQQKEINIKAKLNDFDAAVQALNKVNARFIS
jgi:chromosome segregation ATPase